MLKRTTYILETFIWIRKNIDHKHGYPNFYTQILIEREKPYIFIKTFLNNEEGISKISTCKKIEKFKKVS